MGKSRKKVEPVQETKYTTRGGVTLTDKTHDKKFFANLSHQIMMWVDYQDAETPDGVLDDEQLKYIREQMVKSKGMLTRVEPRTRNFVKRDEKGNVLRDEDGEFTELKEGDTINFNGDLKAFSRTQKATDRFIRENDMGGDLIIYRTPKGTPEFNVTNWSDSWKWEKESWVDSKGWKITNIEDVTDNYSFSKYPEVERIRIVDIVPLN